MKIKGQITILINREYTEIQIRDKNSCLEIAKITLTPEQLSAALGRMAHIECEFLLYNYRYTVL